MSDSAKTSVRISNRLGLHARPAQSFVEVASMYDSSIVVRKSDGHEADGKSIMQMLMLAATKGTELEISAVGPDAKKAITDLIALVNRGFDEE